MLSKYKQHNEAKAYRIYVTDMMYYQAEGKRIAKRYADILMPVKEDPKSADEIIAEVIRKAGLTVEVSE